MKHTKLLSLALFIFLAGCNLPQKETTPPTPTIDLVATQVSIQLTARPTHTPTATPQPASPTPAAAEASPTPLPAPSETPTVTPTTPADDPKNTLGTATWTDTLDTAQSWGIYENANTRVRHENGALLLTGITPNGWTGWTLTGRKPVDYYLEGVFKTQDCSGGDQYGLIFRVGEDNNSGYFFGVTCDGRYGLRSWDGKGFAELQAWTAGNGLISGGNQVNRLGVMVRADHYTLYANGARLNEYTNGAYTGAGKFGAWVAGLASANFTVGLDEISYWELK